MVTINGVELEFDILDANMAERYEKALARMTEKAKENNIGTSSEMIRWQCNTMDAFFEEVYGEGTSIKLFGGSISLRDRISAFEILLKSAKEQSDQLQSIFKNILIYE